MRFSLICTLSFAALSMAQAQPVGFAGPVEGYTFDAPTASLRAIMGFPGAASFGPAVLNGLEFGSAAPSKNYAIAFQSGSFVLVNGLDSGNVSTRAIPSVTRVPDGVAWSSDGTVAVLYSLAGNWLQTISGLPADPVAGASVEVPGNLGTLAAVAVERQGSRIAIATSGSSAGIYLLSSDQSFSPLLQLARPAALSFSNDATQLFAIDAATKSLAVVTLANFSSQITPLDGLADPIAVRQAAGSDQRLYIASRTDRLLREYDMSSQQVVADLPLSFGPTGIDQFGTNSFLVASRLGPADPLWLVTSGAQPAVYFVPAIPQTIGLGRSAPKTSAPEGAMNREGRAR